MGDHTIVEEVPVRTVGTDAVLDIRGLCVDYGVGENAVRAVRDVNLTLRRGEVLGLAGESGSGKSTLAYGLARLLPPPGVVSAGEVIYNPPDGEPVDVLTLSPSALRSFRWAETSIVFQGAMNSLNPVHKISTQLVDVLNAHSPGMGRRAIMFFQQYGIEGVTGAYGSVRQSVESYLGGQLTGAEPCKESQQHHHGEVPAEGEYEKDEMGRLLEEAEMLRQQLEEVSRRLELLDQ